MRRPAILALLVSAVALAGCATSSARPVAGAAPKAIVAAPAPSAPPKLVVAISVDQFSADVFQQYREHFVSGFPRLLNGAVFPSGFQSHAATETCPGHSTLLTGVRPARNGIIANNWFDPGIARADKRVYCAEDETDPASTSRDPVVSANHLKVPTLGEMMKRAWPASRNVAVSAKDRAVMMMGGHDIDAAYWWKNGAFVTLAGRTLSPAVNKVNAAAAATIAKGAPALALPTWCAGRDRAVSVGSSTIGTGRFALEPAKPDNFRVSPRMDAATADLAIALLDEMQLGKGSAPDVLSVSFSASDYVGHAVGTEGAEMCIQMFELDKAVGRLIAALDARGLDYIVVLSADHGGLDTPERLAQQALPRARRAGMELTPGALGKALAEKTGIKVDGPLVYGDGPFGDFYLSRALSAADKARATTALVAMLKANAQVAAVFTADELAATTMPSGSPQDWSLKERARASFDRSRSGDVVALLDRAIVPIPTPAPGYTATHGSPWDYDRRVPILFWRKGMPPMEQPAPVETVDIAPTLTAVLRLAVPEGTFDGRCLDIDGSAANSCGQ